MQWLTLVVFLNVNLVIDLARNQNQLHYSDFHKKICSTSIEGKNELKQFLVVLIILLRIILKLGQVITQNHINRLV